MNTATATQVAEPAVIGDWNPPAPPPAAGGALAVSYLWVSTKERAERGGREKGFSISTQREANLRKAESLGATVADRIDPLPITTNCVKNVLSVLVPRLP